MKKNKDKKTAKTATRKRNASGNEHWAWLVLMVLVTLIYDWKSLEPVLFVRLLALGAFLLGYTAYLLWDKGTQQFTIKSKPVRLFYLTGAVFSVWAIVCSFFSISFYESFFPLAHMFCFGIAAFYLTECLRKQGALDTMIKVLSFLVLFHAIVGILQVSGIGFTNLPGNVQSPPIGFMGNRNIYGGFLAIGLWLPALMAYRSEGTKKWLYVGATFLVLCGIILSQTRTAWLSTLVSSMAVMAGWLFINGFSQYKKLVRPLLTGFVLLTISIGSIVLLSSDLKKELSKRTKAMIEVNLKGERKHDKYAGSMQARIKSWEQSIEMFKDHPVFGVGPDNWKLAVTQYDTTGDLLAERGKIVKLYPHNTFLKVLSEMGLFGLLVYLSMLGIVAYTVVKFLKADTAVEKKMTILFFGASFTAFVIDMMASFSMLRIEHTLLLAFFIAGIFSLTELEPHSSEKETVLKKRPVLFPVILVSILTIILAVAKYQFGINSQKLTLLDKKDDWDSLIKVGESGKSKIVKLNYLTYPIEMYLSNAYLNKGDLVKAEEEIKKAMLYSPNNAVVYLYYGNIYSAQGDYANAIPYYEKGLKIAPKLPNLIKNLSVAYFYTQRCEEAINILERIDLKPYPMLQNLYRDCKARVGK